jgi:hypothetical protein
MVDTRVSLRGSQSDKIRGSDLNLFVTSKYWQAAPLIADDYARATLGTSLRWDILALFHWVKTNFGQKNGVEVWPEIGGSHEDQAINGVLYLLQPEIASQFIDELPIEAVDEEQLLAILRGWEDYSARLIELRTKPKPIELPEPPKPQEPAAPVEAPKPPEGWWDCKECGADSNPPKSQKCMRCHKPRPGAIEEKPEAPKPEIPGVEETPGMAQWKKTALKIAAVLASAGVIVKVFTPSYIDIIWDAVVGILRAIGSM